MIQGTVDITIMETKDVICVEASLGDFSAVGTARRHPDDHPDFAVGVGLAMGRAIRQLGRTMLRSANESVRANSRARQSQQEARARYVANRPPAGSAPRRERRNVGQVKARRPRSQVTGD